MKRPAFLPDNFVLCLLGCVALASVLPAHGVVATGLGALTNAAVALLFFLHGARLSREAVVSGMLHWRLHLLVFLATFALFPLLGLGLKPLFEPLVGPALYLGVLYVCALPSTVQSSIAFTSVGRGNVPAAICSASVSNLLGIFITPMLAGALMASGGHMAFSFDSVLGIVGLLLLPFIAGQVARRWIGGWVERNKAWLKYVDQGSILLVVYGAFSEAMVQGLHRQVSLATLLFVLLACAALLATVMGTLIVASRRLGFSREDEVAIVFCGSKKSLASGVPMAKILFAGHPIGLVVLPLMLFHQMQLMVCAFMARRYALAAQRDAFVEQVA
ncbi:MAG: bile acid:sodium symporter [Alphaproteobacteria bacterium]|nr:MAG: bile acid:sodium symporter [Alphaproteobacteria bacterium]